MDCLVVGAGAVADAYLPALVAAPELSVAAVCDLDEDRARAAAAEYDATAYTDLDAALDAEQAPLVVTLTSHAAHAPVTAQALAADRHVYTEKPLATDPGTARNLVETARRRDLALGCAPGNADGPGQCRAARLLADGRLGRVGLCYAHAHVGRVTEWHDRPDSFLSVGPLYDGAVYPLTLLTTWFGPVARVATADCARPWPARERAQPTAPTHVEAVLVFADGPRVRLTASLYAPHRAREFYALELHGDDGSLYLDDAGALDDATDRVRYGRVGRDYVAVPPARPTTLSSYADGPRRLVRDVERGILSRESARRGAHVVAVCGAIETAGRDGGPVSVDDCGVTARPAPTPVARPPKVQPSGPSALRLPTVAVEPETGDEAATALDGGCRLLVATPDTAGAVGQALDAPGAPARDSIHVAGTVPATVSVDGAVRDLQDALGPFDSLLVAGATDDRWAAARAARDDGIVRALGQETDGDAIRDEAAVVLAEALPSDDRLAGLHDRGVRAVAPVESGDAADGAVAAVAAEHGVSPLQVVVAFATARGVCVLARDGVDHADVLAGAGRSLSDADRERLGGSR